MCFESRIIFACGCEKPKYENGQAQRVCEWAAMRGMPCTREMVGADPHDSLEVMYECFDCLNVKSESSSKTRDGKESKSKLSGLKKKMKR